MPGAMAAFKGRLLVGVDNNLRLYDMGACGRVGGGFTRALPAQLHQPLPLCHPACVALPTHPPSCPPHPHPAHPSPHTGKKRLLRKCEYRRLPTRVATLATTGSRIYVGDGQESMLYMR